MVLQTRNANIMANGQATNADRDQPAKRAVDQQLHETIVPSGEPEPKRAALMEGSDAVGFLPIHEHNAGSENDSIMEVGDLVSNEPCPEYDYDAENIGDEAEVPEYAYDIFQYYKQREKSFVVSDYMTRQRKISHGARALIVNWMVEVQEMWKLNHETLYLTVKLFDLYLARTNDIVHPTQLQLLACAALFIASKYDECVRPAIVDFLDITDDAFTDNDLKALEMKLLNTLGFDVGSPLSYRFLRRYAKASHADLRELTVSRYVLETSLMFYEYARSSESEVAAGAFLLGLRMCDASAEWSPVMHKYSGVGAAVAEEWCWQLNHMLHVRSAGEGVNAQLDNCFQKYSQDVFFSAARHPLLPDKFSRYRPLEAPHRS